MKTKNKTALKNEEKQQDAKPIIPLVDERRGKTVRADYLRARKLVAERGAKLPSNVLFEEHLTDGDAVENRKEIYPAWAREIIVYPKKDGKFEKGNDIVDSVTGWILPATFIPEEAIGREKVGLFIDPEDVEEKGKRVVIPKTIEVVYGFGDYSGNYDIADYVTRIPIDEAEDGVIYIGGEDWGFWRIDGAGVRPLARDISVCGSPLFCTYQNMPPLRWEVAANANPYDFSNVMMETPKNEEITSAITSSLQETQTNLDKILKFINLLKNNIDSVIMDKNDAEFILKIFYGHEDVSDVIKAAHEKIKANSDTLETLAEHLGTTRVTFNKNLKKYGISLRGKE